MTAADPVAAAAGERGCGLDDSGFSAWVGDRRATLHRWAYLICGAWHQAEDLVQATLIKLYGAWPQIAASGATEAYTRRILIRTHIDHQRRAWRRLETPTARLPDNATTADVELALSGDRELWAALAALPERQRKVLVFRFVLDWSVADTAAAMGCSQGTVKSQASRALAFLRKNRRRDEAAG